MQDAPRYGAERRGAPIVAYVRAARETIAERGAFANPDLVLVADASLFQVPAAAVWQGIGASVALLIATADSAALWRTRLAHPGAIYTCDPGGESAHAATALVGAAARMLGVIRRAISTRAKGAVDDLREAGKSVGLVRPRLFRPFPAAQLRKLMTGRRSKGRA